MAPVKPTAAMDDWIKAGKISKATIFSWAKQLREGTEIQAKNTEALKAFMKFQETWQKDMKQAADAGAKQVVKKTEDCKTEIMGQAEANKLLILEKLDKLQLQQAPASSSAAAPQITATAPEIVSEKEESVWDCSGSSEGSESELDLSKLSQDQRIELEDEENRVSEKVGVDHARKFEEPHNECKRKIQEADNESKFEIQEADMDYKCKVQKANNKRKRKAQEAMDECKLKGAQVKEEFKDRYNKVFLVSCRNFKKRLVERGREA